jgi:excisionase family DNA binding protein
MPENLISFEEAAKILNVAPITIRKWTGERKIPFYKIGKAVRFSPTELEQWIRAQHVAPVGGAR